MKRTWLKRVNPERRASELERCFGDLAEYVRWLPCCICGDFAEPCHVKTRRMGGAWRQLPDGTEVGNIAPMCRKHHDEQGSVGIATFQERHRVDLEDIAREVGERFKAGEEPTFLSVPW